MNNTMKTIEIDGYAYPTNEFGHAWTWQEEFGGRTHATTDPMGQGVGIGISLLEDCVPEDEQWDGSDDIFFDYLVLEGHVAIHSMIDCDSNGSVDRHAYEVVRFEDAVSTFENVVGSAWDWFAENVPFTDFYPYIRGEESVNQMLEDLKRDVEGKRTEVLA